MIRCHHLLGDYDAACQIAEEALLPCHPPADKQLLALAVKSYTAAGQRHQALATWRKSEDKKLLEPLAWGLLEEGWRNPAPQVRLLALAAATETGGGEAVALIEKGLHDSSALVRAVACQCGAMVRSRSLIPSLLSLLERERYWQVRGSAIAALAMMRAKETAPSLLRAAARATASPEERRAGAAALVLIDEGKAGMWVSRLARDPSPAYRLLACDVAIFGRSGIDVLITLLDDIAPQVESSALQALGVLLREWEPSPDIIAHLLRCGKASDAHVAASAGWLLTILDHPEGPNILERLLRQPGTTARCAAAALAGAGERGTAISQKLLKSTKETAVAATLAMGLLGQRCSIPESVAILRSLLHDNTIRWRWHHFGIFRALSPARGDHDEELVSSDIVDATVRLELLNLLAIVDPEAALLPLRHFLQSRTAAVSGAAAALLLTEGDDSAIELIEELMQHAKNEQHKLQAALVLALWGKSGTAVAPLHSLYGTAPRRAKEQLLAAIGHIGADESLPLLVEALESPTPSLRIHAAAALLQALAH